MDRTRKSYVLVYIDALTQKKTSVKAKDLKLDPEQSDLTLEQVFDNIEKRFDYLEKEIKNLKSERTKDKKTINNLLKVVTALNLKK